MQTIPLVTVTCVRDLYLLELQAQSLSIYLKPGHDVIVIVNENDPTEWDRYFDANIRQFYFKHNLQVFYRKDFLIDWSHFPVTIKNPWAGGWETQQILKIAAAEKTEYPGYLVLDSQNFLIRPWNFELRLSNKLPFRTGKFVMPLDTWNEYCSALDVDTDLPNDNTLCICTPIFLSTPLVRSLIKYKNDINSFALWFKKFKGKSEFILYLLWAIKNGGLEQYHYDSSGEKDDWSGSYLRDSPTFDKDFEQFIGFVGAHEPHKWVSINHRSWGDMNDNQYNQMVSKLMEYQLTPNFLEYRKHFLERYR
jgi:Family of unknown function (DUF6492)